MRKKQNDLGHEYFTQKVNVQLQKTIERVHDKDKLSAREKLKIKW